MSKLFHDLRRLEATISQECEPGYDPYNSHDRFNPWVLTGYALEVAEPTEADKAARSSPRITLTLPAGLIALGAGPLERFAPDEFNTPAT